MTAARLVKLQPNQDLVIGLEQACAAIGWPRARIVAGVCSLTAATVRGDDGALAVVAGPAVEVAALSGIVVQAGASQLRAWCCAQDTHAIDGALERGRNAIAVTAEVVLIEIEEHGG